MTVEISIRLVVDDWRKKGQSVRGTPEYTTDLVVGPFHSGSAFPGTITLNNDNAAEFLDILQEGYQPVFWVIL